MMLAEIQSNNVAARRLAGDDSKKSGRNVAVGVVGVLLFPPLLFALDLKGAAKTEMNALRDRNRYLGQLMVSKKCVNRPEVIMGPPGQEDVEQRIKAAQKSGKQPLCKDVGGYALYKKKTGKICKLN